MTYSTRNSFYLRISKNTVLPLYIYLDERHIEWMSDGVLQHVLSDLRPNILSKLKIEAEIVSGTASAQKRATVDTHRGDTYQFCYFIRKMEPHSVLIKSRKFTVAPTRAVSNKSRPPSKASKRSAKRKHVLQDTPPQPSNKKRNKKRRLSPEMDDDDEEIENDTPNADSGDEEYLPSHDMAISESEETTPKLQIEEDEEKPKPILGLTYQGFNIYGQCLCVVVEPWPVIRSATVPAFLLSKPSNQGSRPNPSSAMPGQKSNIAEPLFLPEDPEDELPHTDSNHSHINKSYLNQVLNEAELSDEDDIGGMMEFSQVLYNIGDSRAGAVNDDDDADGSILFGDADEFKEL